MTATTYYDILEVSPSASQTVISAAYRTLTQKFHPDKNNGNKSCEEIMAKINVAFGVLSDPIKRKIYDDEIGVNKAKDNSVQKQQASVTKQEVDKPQAVKIEQDGSNNEMLILFTVVSIFAAIIFISVGGFNLEVQPHVDVIVAVS